MKIRDVLLKARRLIRNKTRWTQGYLAENKFGHYCYPKSKDAVKFCALGAINWASPSERIRHRVENFVRNKCTFPNGGRIVYVNDQHGHEAVMKLFDEAIKKAPR